MIADNSQTKKQAASLRSIESAKVLVVDDNVDLLKLMSIRLKPMNFELKTATSAEQALSILSLWRADLVISDLQMAGMSGMELFDQIHAKDPLLPVIILTAHGTIPDAVEATQAGVASYLTKPFDSDALLEQIEVALLTRGFSNSLDRDPEAQHADGKWRDRIISQSPTMETLMHQIGTLSEGKGLLVIEGEHGTGKDELAHTVHARSDRANQSLIHLSATAIPSELLNAEVFGLSKNDQSKQSEREGLLQKANQGTLLISDFNEMPTSFLQKLLAAILASEAHPIDSHEPYSIDIRPIMTADDAEQHLKPKSTIWDLCGALELATVSVPSLRDRREDIPLLIQHTLQEQNPGNELQFSNKAMQQMLAAEWQGNVRHLVNVVKQCMRLSKTKIISEKLVNSLIGSAIHRVQPLTNAHREFERTYLTEALKVTNGNVTRAANLAKRNRTEFHRLLKKHKIEAKSFRQ